MGLGPGTWVYENELIGLDIATLYLKSLHWSVQTLVTVGFGDTVAYNSGTIFIFSPFHFLININSFLVEKIYSIIWMFIGVAFYSYTVFSIAMFISESNQ